MTIKSNLKKSIHGICWFGNDNCWFIHQEVDDSEKITKDDEITKDKEMVAKIFDMMEAFTKRLITIGLNFSNMNITKN